MESMDIRTVFILGSDDFLFRCSPKLVPNNEKQIHVKLHVYLNGNTCSNKLEFSHWARDLTFFSLFGTRLGVSEWKIIAP